MQAAFFTETVICLMITKFFFYAANKKNFLNFLTRLDIILGISA